MGVVGIVRYEGKRLLNINRICNDLVEFKGTNKCALIV